MIKLILFGILKGIGILLLVLLFLLLLMVLVVLLSPIRYHLEGEKRAAVSGSFGVSWLFGAIRADGGYTPEGGSRLKLGVLWFTPVGGEEKPKKKKKKKKRKEPEPIEIHAAEREPEKEKPKQALKQEPKQPKQAPKQSEPKNQAKPQRMAEKQPKTMRRVKLSEIAEKPPEPEEIEDDAFFTGEEQEKAEEPEKKEKIPPILKELWSIEDKKQIFKAFGKLLKRLLKGILPGNFFLKATIGTGDPPTTGYLLGLAGILVAKFGNDIQIKGDFTKATVEDIEIRVKGKIVLGRLLWTVLAFGLTKPVRTVVGDAIVVGDMTLLPLIDVAVGAGVGAKESANAAGGMGARITPSAILMIRPDGVQLINVKNQDALSKLIDMAPGVVNKLNFGAVFSGRNKKDRAQEEVKFEEETIIEE